MLTEIDMKIKDYIPVKSLMRGLTEEQYVRFLYTLKNNYYLSVITGSVVSYFNPNSFEIAILTPQMYILPTQEWGQVLSGLSKDQLKEYVEIAEKLS